MSQSNSFAIQMSAARTMQIALGKNLLALAKRGMNEEFIIALRETIIIVNGLNSEQERLKGELKVTTSELDAVKKQLKTKVSEAVKVVKLELPKERWIEFGITGRK